MTAESPPRGWRRSLVRRSRGLYVLERERDDGGTMYVRYADGEWVGRLRTADGTVEETNVSQRGLLDAERNGDLRVRYAKNTPFS